MQWINDHRFEWGGILLVLLIISLLGTWGFDLLHVPAQYDCGWPNVRLEGDFCGTPCPGIWFPSMLIVSFLKVLVGTITISDLGVGAADILWLLPFLLIPLPVISALVWIATKNRPRQWIIHLAAWGLAAIFIWYPYNVMVLTSDDMVHPIRRWGLWLYTALVTTVFIIELVQFINRKRYNPDRSLSGSQAKDSAEIVNSSTQPQ
jgi:hypothetical protein